MIENSLSIPENNIKEETHNGQYHSHCHQKYHVRIHWRLHNINNNYSGRNSSTVCIKKTMNIIMKLFQ